MTPAENKLLVRRLLEEVRNGWSPAVMEEFFSPGYRRHLNPTAAPLTADGQRQRASTFRAAFPDARATIEDILAEGDRVAYRLTIRGTHRGVFRGILPTGRQVTVSLQQLGPQSP